MTYLHGVSITQKQNDSQTLDSNNKPIALLATSNDADQEYFPLNEPVLVRNIAAAITKAGTNGTLSIALQALATQGNPRAWVCRVSSEADSLVHQPADSEDETEDKNDEVADKAEKPVSRKRRNAGNIIKDNKADKTGVYALLRISGGVSTIIAPNLESVPLLHRLVEIAQKLQCMVYAKCIGNDIKEAVEFRKKFQARELMLFFPDIITVDKIVAPVSAVAASIRVKIDDERGIHKTISNVAVNKIEKLSQNISWAPSDTNSDANYLNENHITTLIYNKGWHLWGQRTCAESQYYFENYVRVDQCMREVIIANCMPDVDKPLDKTNLLILINKINTIIRKFKGDGMIIDGKCFEGDANTPNSIMIGKIYLGYDFAPVPPIECISISQGINTKYYNKVTGE